MTLSLFNLMITAISLHRREAVNAAIDELVCEPAREPTYEPHNIHDIHVL